MIARWVTGRLPPGVVSERDRSLGDRLREFGETQSLDRARRELARHERLQAVRKSLASSRPGEAGRKMPSSTSRWGRSAWSAKRFVYPRVDG